MCFKGEYLCKIICKEQKVFLKDLIFLFWFCKINFRYFYFQQTNYFFRWKFRYLSFQFNLLYTSDRLSLLPLWRPKITQTIETSFVIDFCFQIELSKVQFSKQILKGYHCLQTYTISYVSKWCSKFDIQMIDLTKWINDAWSPCDVIMRFFSLIDWCKIWK